MQSLPASSDVRELCEAVSQEKDPEQMMLLVDELLRVRAPARRDLALSNTLISPRLEVCAMKGKTKQHWMALCEQAAVEQDSEKLLELIHEIDRMLDDKEQRLKHEVDQHQKPALPRNA